MDQYIDWFFFSFLFSGLLGFLVSSILVFANQTESFGSRLLAGFLFCFSLLAVNYTLMTSRFYISHPHWWKVFGWASFCYAPFSYLYVRSVLEQSFKFKRWDFLLFIPAILHPLALLPFYLKPADEKIAFLKEVLENPRLITLEPESVMPEGFFLILRILVGIVAILAQFIILWKWKKKSSQEFLQQEQNQSTFKWLFFFTTVMAIFWGLVLLQYIFQFGTRPNLNITFLVTIAGTILFVSIYLLLQPSILYGLKGWNREAVQPASVPEVPEAPILEERTEAESRRTSLSYEQGQKIKQALETHFEQNLPFRKKGYMISDLSRELKVPTYMLSAFINQEYGKNFNELINDHRVQYLIREAVTMEDLGQYTLEALGKHAGFNSRAAFIAAVKKTTGKNPSELFNRKQDRKA